MRSHYRVIPALVLVVSLPLVVMACLWDYDTLKQERARFPDALELITGKFLRHSKEFYEWRIADRLKKLESAPNEVSHYDDLAVAYQKTGQNAKAIETILAKDKIKPGLYETYSNLGTFYVLAGELEKGLPFIDKALAINPDAHFGREKYQKWLVEYALTRVKDGKLTLPLRRDYYRQPGSQFEPDFAAFLAKRLGKQRLSPEDGQTAVKGILGMMRFANHDNPLLLEALGDLLGDWFNESTDAKRLAARGYLKASYVVQDGDAKEAYRDLAQHALKFQSTDLANSGQLPLASLEADFSKQLADADEWYAELKGKELSWVNAGTNVDAEFDKLYTEEPVAPGEPSDEIHVPIENQATDIWIPIGATIFFGLVITSFFLWRRTTAESQDVKPTV